RNEKTLCRACLFLEIELEGFERFCGVNLAES
ncbi:MAG: hypothetical protein ACI8P5_002242, partial [Bacteroidia bacterium]